MERPDEVDALAGRVGGRGQRHRPAAVGDIRRRDRAIRHPRILEARTRHLARHELRQHHLVVEHEPARGEQLELQLRRIDLRLRRAARRSDNGKVNDERLLEVQYCLRVEMFDHGLSSPPSKTLHASPGYADMLSCPRSDFKWILADGGKCGIICGDFHQKRRQPKNEPHHPE